jgi:UrcA family protein
MVNVSSLFGIGLALSAATPPQLVVSTDGVPTTNVRLDDLDLSREQDIVALRARVRAAARTVCSSRHNPGALYLETASCRKGTISQANEAVWNALRRHASGDAPLIASILISRGF